MSNHSLNRFGVTLPEIIVVLVLVGILTALAAPAAGRWVSLARVRSSLDQISGEIYKARMLAVERGEAVTVVLSSEGGCVRRALTRARAVNSDTLVTVGVVLDASSMCLQHTGDSILTFNARGMLRPPTRSIYTADNLSADSLLISIAGRIRRNY